MVGVVEDETLPCTVNALEIKDGIGRLEIRTGPKGIPGIQGDASYGFALQGKVADQATLDAITVTAANAGKAWWVAATRRGAFVPSR